jgi:PKD repeat protein
MKQIAFIILFILSFNTAFSINNSSLPPLTASISGGTTVCQNTTGVLVTFTGNGGTAPYTFTYTVTGVAGNQTISTTGTNNSVTLSVSTVTAGTFTYNLVKVEDSSAGHAPINVSDNTIINVSTSPTVDFTFNNDNSCSGTTIQFTSSVSGSGTTNYSWDFGDSTTISTQANPTHTFTSLGCGTTTFTVTLTVTKGGCTVVKTHTITVKQKPDISFVDVNFPFDPFSNCSNASSNPVYSITVGNTSVSTCITSYSINWGDGNSQSNISFPISHTYTSIGAYSMVISSIGNNGCSNSKTYIIKNVSNPLGGLNSPGSTQNLCAPTSNLQFSISNWGTNSLDTTYTINYGDASPILTLTQNQLISSIYYNSTNPSSSSNYPVPHIYSTSNCPTTSFVVTLDVTNACGTTPFTLGNISILTKPITNFTAPTIGCVNVSITFTNTTIAGYSQNCAQSSIYTWNFGDGTPIITTPPSTPQNITHVFTSPGNYTVTLTAQNFCGTTTKTQQICIEPPLTPLFTLNTTSGCTPLAITATNNTDLTNQCSPPTYLWEVTHTPLYCATTTVSIPNQTTANASYNFTESGTYAIKLTMSNSCGSVFTTQTVTIKKPPTVSIAAISNFCGSASITPSATVTNCAPSGGTLTYAWSFPGGTPSTASTLNPGTITYPAGGPYTVSLVVTNECGPSNTATQNFTVNVAPVITNTNLSQTICSGSQTTLVNLTANPAGTTFSWNATATAGITGFTPSGTTNTIPAQTISTTNTNPGIVTYVITPTIGTCVGATVNYVVNVIPAPTITTQPASSSVCLGGTPTLLSVVLNSSSVTPTYQWYSNTSSSTSGGTLIPGATNATYSPPATATGTIYYYCVISLSSGGCSSITSSIATVTVNPLPTITSQPLQTQTICQGGIISALTVVYSGGLGTSTYQWYSNTTNATTGGSPVGTNSNSYTPPSFNTAGTFYYYVTISLTGNGCGAVTSQSAEIIVVNDPTITTQPLTTQTLCQNATPTALTVVATGGIGTFSYQWYSTLTLTNTGGNPVGTNAPTFIPPTNVVGTFYYYCSVAQTGLNCDTKSNSATVIINASPTVVNQPNSSTVCQNGTVTPLSFTYSNGVGTPTYQWFSNTSNSNIGGTLLTGETNATFNPPTATVGITYYYCIITFPSLTGSCAAVSTNTANITINSGATIDIQPLPTQSICVGGTIQNPLTVSFINGTGTPTYQWYSTNTNTTTGGTPVGTNSPNYSPPVFNTVGSFYYYVTISFSGNGCGSITSAAAEIVIVSDPIVSTQPIATQTLCQNATAATLTVTASGGIGTYSYQWHSNTTNSSSGGTLISGATTNTFTPPTTNAGTLYYYCEITQPTGIGCNVSSQTSTVNVNIAPTIGNNPNSSTVCLGQTPTQLTVTYSNGSGAPVYQWYSNTSNSNIGGTAITTETGATFNPSSATAGTFYYYCTITFPSLSGGCEVITSNVATVIIEQIPIISNQTATICSSASFTITPTNTATDSVPTGTTYTWSTPTINPIGSIIGAMAEATPQTSISQALINTTTAIATATYTVTPTIGTCTGATFTITVTVNPATNPNAIKTDITCFGSNNGSITTTITGGIPFVSGAPYLISWTGPNGFSASSTNISNLIPGSYNLSITDAGGCPISNNYTILEPTDIVITTDTNNNITCFGSDNGAIAISVTGGTVAYTYAWTKNGIPFATTEDISNLAPATYIVSVSDANNCGPKTATFTITEPPILSINLVSQTNVDCYGFATGAITVSASGGTPIQTTPGVFDYNFVWTGPNGFTSTNQNSTNLLAGTYNLTVTDNLGCTKDLAVTITESPEIIINATTTPIVCYGDNNATITVTISGGHAPYQVQWSNLAVGLFQNNLAPGDYIITVTDNIGCIKTATINIPSPPIFTVNPVVTNISCFGAHDGSIVLNFVGGIAPVNLIWSDGSPAGTTRNNLGTGTYSVIITDSKPCTISRTFTILEPQPLVLSANTTNALDCNNANTGAINLLVSGGTPPFTYSWNNGTTTEDLTNIPAGNYAITVTDARGCTKTALYNITRPNPLTLSVNTTTNANCSTHTVTQIFTAQPTGGVPPYLLNWSSGTVTGANNEFMTTTQNGLVIVTATDAIGCTTNYSLNVALPILGNPTFSPTSIGQTTYGIYAILDPIQFNSAIIGDYTSIVWNFGDGTFSNEINPIHTYLIPNDYYLVTLTVTYPFGCVYVYNLALNVEKGYIMVVPNAFTPYKIDGINDTFRPVTKGLKNIHLDIYDTWGSLIYSEVGDTIIGWNGKIKEVSSENGNYYAKVSGETFYGTIINENQTFVLIK